MTGKAAHPQEIASSLVRFDRYLDYAVRTLLKERVGFFLRKRGAAVKSCDAVCLYSSSREKVNLENPQIFQIYKY